MKHANTTGRGLALVAGAAFVAGSLDILLGDVLTTPSAWTHYHALTVLLVFGTIAAGHLAATAKRTRHFFAALGFTVLFLTGSALVVYSSAGRQAATAATAGLSAADVNAQRDATLAELSRARTMLSEAQSDLAEEAKRGGCRKKCEGIKVTISVYEAAIAGHEARLDKLGPAVPVNPEAAYAAKLIGLFGFDEATSAIILLLLMPFLKTVFFEVGAIVSLSYAFRHDAPVASDTAQTSFGSSGPLGPTPPKGPRRRLPSKVVAFPGKHPVIAALERNGGSVGSNRELALLMGVSGGEASKRCREVAHLLDTCRQGKEVRISLKAATVAA